MSDDDLIGFFYKPGGDITKDYGVDGENKNLQPHHIGGSARMPI